MKRSALICTFLWPALFATGAPRWNIQFLYDKADSNFSIDDLQCPTARHCVAGGSIDDKRGHAQGVVVVSSDAGQHWSQYDVKEQPISLFFLNDGLGWMVTDRGLWTTEEGGRTWTKIDTRKGILQAWFLDANHGYMVGQKGLVEETTNGGKSWTAVETSEHVPDARGVNYQLITFRGSHGLIVGAPESSAPEPVLLERGENDERARASGKLIILETVNGGQKWTSGSVSIDGQLAQLCLSERGYVVSLILYPDPKYPVASAVYETPLGARDGRIIFAERDRYASDIALLNNGRAVLATVEPPGNSTQVPIPGKLKILESNNLKVWKEMDVDYRALAQRAVIAAPDAQNVWVATDTGAILKLVE
jgi:hypothetical protein